MKNTFGLMSLLCLTALASACGGGGGGGGGDGGGGATPTPTTSPSPSPTPGPVTDDDARRRVLADLGIFAILAVAMTVRTGGLEAAVVMHAVNNVVIMVVSLVFGGFEDGFVSADTTRRGASAMLLVAELVADEIRAG